MGTMGKSFWYLAFYLHPWVRADRISLAWFTFIQLMANYLRTPIVTYWTLARGQEFEIIHFLKNKLA